MSRLKDHGKLVAKEKTEEEKMKANRSPASSEQHQGKGNTLEP